MRNQIKKITIGLALTCFSLGQSQTREIDSLIRKIDNKDAYIVLTRTASPRAKGTSANRIIAIGKTASPELIKILDSQNKGIVAHFILSKIWKNLWEEQACCAIKSVGNVEIITINGLEISIEDNILSATPENLKKNQQIWKKNCPA